MLTHKSTIERKYRAKVSKPRSLYHLKPRLRGRILALFAHRQNENLKCCEYACQAGRAC
ncbi:hypothetical protein [Helicobacter sp. 23-1046]